MSRKHPFPEIDRAIAGRLAKLRALADLSRRALAERAKLDPDVVERIELGRMPLRYGEATALLPELASVFGITGALNPLWLTDGAEPRWLEWPFGLPDWRDIGLNYKTPFSEFVCNNREVLAALAKDSPSPELPESWLGFYVVRWVRLVSEASRSERGLESLGRVLRESAERHAPVSRHAAELLVTIQAMQNWRDKRVLTNVVPSDNRHSMQDEMQKLRARLTKATAARNQKAALAKWLGIPLSSVSTWLAGRKNPSGKTTLRLLRWVEQQEAQQQQSPDSATTPPGSKAQSKASNEKAKSS